MAVKKDYVTWQTGLPEGSEALADLDSFCEEMGGITRQEASRMIMLMWSKARRGKLTQMLGFVTTPLAVGNVTEHPGLPTPENKEQMTKPGAVKRSKGNGKIAVKGLDFE